MPVCLDCKIRVPERNEWEVINGRRVKPCACGLSREEQQEARRAQTRAALFEIALHVTAGGFGGNFPLEVLDQKIDTQQGIFPSYCHTEEDRLLLKERLREFISPEENARRVAAWDPAKDRVIW